MKICTMRLLSVIIFYISASCPLVHATSPFSFANDAAHFYQTPSFHGYHPTLEKNYCSTLHIMYTHGSTKRGKDNYTNKRRILDTFGFTNLRDLTKGVAHVPPAVQASFDALEIADTAKQVGIVGFRGKVEIEDLQLLVRQNFIKNFFIEMNLPFKKVRINQISLIDESPFIQPTNPAGQAAWENLKGSLNLVLKSFAMSHYDVTWNSKYRFDDMRIYGGWHTKKTCAGAYVEEVLITLRGGLLLPTGASFKTNHPFALATSYNHHLGIPLRADIAITMPYAIKLGWHGGVTFFTPHHNTMRVKTNANQSGLIRLEKKRVKEHYEPAVFLGYYLLADHFVSGLSLMAGYSFTGQGRRLWETMENIPDNSRSGWYAHTIHSALEFDFHTFNCFKKRHWAPYLNLFINYQPSGRNTWVTNTLGTAVGLEINWRY